MSNRALITMWSSLGIIEPFRDPQRAFSGLEGIFDAAEIKALAEQRTKYLKKVEGWCTHSLVDNTKVSERSPFLKRSISIDIKPSARGDNR